MEIQKAGHIRFEIESEEDRQLLASGIHILDFLDKSGRGDLERRAVVNHVCNALFSDMLHFIYEALRALEKRKFTVAFSLLRKPLKEGMLIIAQMCADEVAFFDKMKSDAKNLLNRRDLDKEGILTYGGRAFVRGDISQNLFAHVELEAMSRLGAGDDATRQWDLSLPVGGGYRQKIGSNAYFNVTLLFDVLNPKTTNNRSPFSYRGGVTYDLGKVSKKSISKMKAPKLPDAPKIKAPKLPDAPKIKAPKLPDAPKIKVPKLPKGL